ncbi:MAG: hypothetical protein KAR87_01790 [Candidatus Aenigmarchaeota archaeon]|nr:hypothetical protein [Candidatus Aenigmarchaeota archaeon]MCK5176584.1 hypothetical protein [Candidatus Aenigmarchaeota archaeon]
MATDKREECFKRASSIINKYRTVAGSRVIIFGFAVSILIACIIPTLTGIGLIGIVVLTTMLVGGNILSKEHQLTTGEVRRAIAVSCTAVLFGLLAFGDTIFTNSTIVKSILEKFWLIYLTIIGFYFGGRSAEKIAENIAAKKPTDNNTASKKRK